jgi:hypothetical protein
VQQSLGTIAHGQQVGHCGLRDPRQLGPLAVLNSPCAGFHAEWLLSNAGNAYPRPVAVVRVVNAECLLIKAKVPTVSDVDYGV